MKIKTKELLRATEMIFKQMEKRGIKEVELLKDYYWEYPYPEIYDMENDSIEKCVGQLYDDWEFLDKILKGDSEPIGYGLVWLSSLFRYIGETHKA